MVKAEVKEEKKEVEEPAEPLKYKISVLKVSIHCEGCRRKVKKILHGIEGVYTTEIDLRQQKVTVKGDVEAETLIKRLAKSGKHAELWPVKKKQQWKSKNKEKQSDPDSGEEAEDAGCGDKAEEKTADAAKKGCNAGASLPKNGVVLQVKEVGGEVKRVATSPTVNQTGLFLGEGAGVEKSGGGSGGGGRKKKKKKGHRGNSGNNSNNNREEEGLSEREQASNVPASTGLAHVAPSQGMMFHPANPSRPPGQHGYRYPPQAYYADAAPPVHAVSHHTAYPSNIHSAQYYYAPRPQSQAYEYAHCFSPEIERLPLDFESYCSLRQSETFEIFSDENPNACSLM